jgi:hypothetical protein
MDGKLSGPRATLLLASRRALTFSTLSISLLKQKLTAQPFFFSLFPLISLHLHLTNLVMATDWQVERLGRFWLSC